MEDRFCAFSVKFSNDGSEIIASWGAAGFVCGMTRCGTLSPFVSQCKWRLPLSVQQNDLRQNLEGTHSISANKLFPFLLLPPYFPSPSHLPRVPPSLLPFLHPSPTPLSYTPLLLPPRTHRLMHIRMMLTQSRLQMKVLRSSSRVGMMGYARCGTGGPSLKHTVTLLVSWRDTRMELPSLTLRYACPHIHTLISSLNTVHVVMQIHTHTHALTHTSLI